MQFTPTFQVLKMLALRNFVHLRKYVGPKVLFQQFQKPHRYNIKNDCRSQLTRTGIRRLCWRHHVGKASRFAPGGKVDRSCCPPITGACGSRGAGLHSPKLRLPAQPWEVFQSVASLETPPPPYALIRDHPSAKTKEDDAASRHQRARLAPKRTAASAGGAACTCPGRTRGGGVG